MSSDFGCVLSCILLSPPFSLPCSLLRSILRSILPLHPGTNCLLKLSVSAGGENKTIRSHNVIPFHTPKTIRLPSSTITVNIGKAVATKASTTTTAEATTEMPVKLTASATALYVTLTTLASGRFSDNVILLEAGVPTTVSFLFWADSPGDAATKKATQDTQEALLRSSLRVEHLAENLSPKKRSA